MINWPYIHLLINHFPVVLAIVGLGVVILAMIFQRRVIWLYAMVTLTAAGALVYPVRLSGDEADEALRDPWYIKHGVIEAHNDASLYALIFLLIAGAVSAYGWWRAVKRPDEPIPAWIKTAVFLTALLGSAAVARTAYLGGKIIHDAPVLTLPNPPANLPPGIVSPPDSAATGGEILR